MYPSETYTSSNKKGKYLFILILMFTIIISTNYFALSVPADTIEVIAKYPETGKNSIYQINFIVSKAIHPRAGFRVTFSDGFDLSDLLIAGSTTINGGFDLSVEKQVVIIKRSGLGREIPANEKVDIKFAIVKNPREPRDDYKIVVEILDETEKSIVKQEKLLKVLPQKQ